MQRVQSSQSSRKAYPLPKVFSSLYKSGRRQRNLLACAGAADIPLDEATLATASAVQRVLTKNKDEWNWWRRQMFPGNSQASSTFKYQCCYQRARE